MSLSSDPFAGMATLDAAGVAVVDNANMTDNVCVSLTAQSGGTQPTGSMYVQARVLGTSFTIASTAGAADADVVVYWAYCWAAGA